MALPPITQNWLFATNQRITYVSLNDAMSRLLYGVKNFLVATCGYTVKYTCDGTTGPSSSSDHTDRWSSQANVTTRGAAAGNAQSFAVLTDGNGVDILLTYQGASDDVARIAMSPSGVYVPAGTANQQPTATDELTILTGQSVIAATASLDRVWHIQATSDKKLFRCWVYRARAMTYSFGVERVISNVTTGVNLVVPVVGWATSASAPGTSGAGHVLSTGTANNGGITLVNSIQAICGGGGEVYLGTNNAGPFGTTNVSDLQAGAIIVPICFATTTTNAQGKVGNRIDAWTTYEPAPAQGDLHGDLTHVTFGTGLWPWDGTTYVETA